MKIGKLISLKNLSDDRGGLVAVESQIDIPFEIKRTYYIFETKTGVERGFHAHRDLTQLVICLKGSCDFLLDDGKNREKITLNSSYEGLLIDGLIWREMRKFSDDCVLAVLASAAYDESDYIRSYETFKMEAAI